jgi:16S rRNA (adenine1518-N6/adenine1519-N6)-dimethyltransferase
MSLLSLAVQLRGKPSIARYVERDSFSPPPEVRSAILAIDIYSKPMPSTDLLWRLARVGFASRRKQLKNNLAGGMGVTVAKASDWLEQAGLSVQARAQDLSVEDWLVLAGEAKKG